MHVIHANRVGETPWGWRDATVVAVDDLVVTARYVLENGSVRIWHHESLESQLEAGAPVRVHEGYHALGARFGWVNAVVVKGIGEVPEPADREMWRPEMTVGAVDLATGVAIALDHADRASDADPR